MKDYRVGSESRAPVSTVVRLATLSMDDLPPWLSETFTRVPVFLAAHGSYPDRASRLRGITNSAPAASTSRPVPGGSTRPGSGRSASVEPAGRTGGNHHAHRVPRRPCPLSTGSVGLDHGPRGPGGSDSWEVYFGDLRTSTESEAWRTEIVQPYRLGVPASSGV